MGYIYLRTNRINGKKYVGQATDLEVRQRTWNNLNQPYAGTLINRARAKYGIEAFGFEILKECEDEELDYWEKYYIKELNTKVPYGYNMTDGGGGMSGFTISDETRKKLSEAHRGKKHYMYGKHHSDETRKKISESHKGKHRSDETKKKLSEWNKGKKLSEETRIKMSESRKGEKHWLYGKHHTEETRKKLSDAHKGKTAWNKGKKHSEETRKKISEKHINGKKSKLVLQIDKTTNEVIAEFPSTMEVERQLGIRASNISKCCKGKQKTCGGFKWQYK